MAASQPPAHEVDDEQSMEEILQSIRRIIAEEDEQQQQTASAEQAAPEEDVLELTEIFEAPELHDSQAEVGDPLAAIDAIMAGSPAPSFEPEPEPYVPAQEFTPEPQAYDGDAFGAESQALAQEAEQEAEPAYEPEPAPEPSFDDDEIPAAPAEEYAALDTLISDEVANVATNSLKAIKQTAKAAQTKIPHLAFRSGTTVEELMMEALRPMLKEWLDLHLASTVERIVAREIHRLVEHVEQS